MPTVEEQQRTQEQQLAQQLGVDVPTARQIMANRQLQDTKILQKVGRVNREAFKEKYPGQLEHCLRLVMERLQAGLDKRGSVHVNDPNTWILSANETAALCEAAERLDRMRRAIPQD